ncbi:hypothetical protein K438DRAFT_1945229 [Mycena galopus ATCC 62051]|nr:hypothetical protein K438DRAFT_1945229 [Mycena galopus ATCC 62051]
MARAALALRRLCQSLVAYVASPAATRAHSLHTVPRGWFAALCECRDNFVVTLLVQKDLGRRWEYNLWSRKKSRGRGGRSLEGIAKSKALACLIAQRAANAALFQAESHKAPNAKSETKLKSSWIREDVKMWGVVGTVAIAKVVILSSKSDNGPAGASSWGPGTTAGMMGAEGKRQV